MLFKDADAHAKHRHSAYRADFVKILYPCCEKKPLALDPSSFAGRRSARSSLVPRNMKI